ncbi:SubName: Full=Uncharacterized protein {ECO:0000313/EMBL:CCA75393.1} [Serendipita indica DSM 11827]|uniref:Uncharacterized protein n=1 Tax=Serendipita indica (strain DSM 11827) TaxID=1109443 RepID=G4TVQ0_SERID|nr:SubName: Full=Uncharacterized protein {ECO:0000313/EMBL:CCA75393.1} [Serendipita indica DSM 11827]CCA75393.1 hypothetical protein PIIN_09376 [Serendipita indica DSM 11827]
MSAAQSTHTPRGDEVEGTKLTPLATGNAAVSQSTSTTTPSTTSVHAPPPAAYAPNAGPVTPNVSHGSAQGPSANSNGPQTPQPSQPSTTNGVHPTHNDTATTTDESVEPQWNGPDRTFSGFIHSS